MFDTVSAQRRTEKECIHKENVSERSADFVSFFSGVSRSGECCAQMCHPHGATGARFPRAKMNCSQQVNANASGGKIENVFVPREPPMCGCAARTGGPCAHLVQKIRL